MAKREPADALQKRLQKIEQAHTRLGAIATRIRAQADIVADLVSLTRAFRADAASSAPSRRRVARSTPKRAPAQRAARAAKATSQRRPSSAAAKLSGKATTRAAKPPSARRQAAG
jgi:hypothetical protein